MEFVDPVLALTASRLKAAHLRITLSRFLALLRDFLCRKPCRKLCRKKLPDKAYDKAWLRLCRVS
jgi:hypothetical protein